MPQGKEWGYTVRTKTEGRHRESNVIDDHVSAPPHDLGGDLFNCAVQRFGLTKDEVS